MITDHAHYIEIDQRVKVQYNHVQRLNRLFTIFILLLFFSYIQTNGLLILSYSNISAATT